MDKELVMYSRSWGCPFVSLAKRVLADYGVTYQEIMIDIDGTARERVLDWTGFLSVPTLVVAHPGEIVPYTTPTPLTPGYSPRGINRGTMITEPNVDQLVAWLMEQGFIDAF
ncbi:MAG: glutaredoxin family protein [Anaerolineaceae bacterium]|nr:glutaredoxin family protein [Anaerolineaceae bacterium]